MAFAINKLRNALAVQNNYNVLVTILTDGEENASREHSAFDIKNLIDELKLKNWTFTYIGTDHDVEKIALSLSITNTLVFEYLRTLPEFLRTRIISRLSNFLM